MSILLSLMDFIPVVLFIISSVTLQRCLYYRMSKGAFAVFSAGMIMIICSGIFKAIWKLLYSLGICDFERLNQSFFPMQSVGFLLAGTATIAMVFFRQDNGEKLYQIGTPTVFSGTILFIAANILGSLGLCGGLAIESKRCGKVRPAVFFILSFFFLLTLGYLGTKDFTNASVNWTSEAVNILAVEVKLEGDGRIQRQAYSFRNEDSVIVSLVTDAVRRCYRRAALALGKNGICKR